MNDSTEEKVVPVGALLAEIAEVISTWPLYREFKYKAGHYTQEAGIVPGLKTHYAILPEEIKLFCHHKKCGNAQLWQLAGQFGSENHVALSHDSVHSRKYVCRNCGHNAIHYFFVWKETEDGGSLAKVGQYPPLTERIPAALRKQLNEEDLGFYEKAIRLRNHGLGIVSLAYLRRAVENRTNDMLGVLTEIASGCEIAGEELAKIEGVRAGKRFDDKIS